MNRLLSLIALLCLFAIPAAAQTYTSPTSGTISAISSDCSVANSCVWLKVNSNVQSVTVAIAGSFSATLSVEASTDVGQSWNVLALPTAALTRTFQAPSGMTDIRVRGYSYTSGSASVTLTANAPNNPTGNGNVSPGMPGNCAQYTGTTQIGDAGAPCGSGSGSGLFTSFQLGGNTPITATNSYLQITADSNFFPTYTGSGTSGSPFTYTFKLANSLALGTITAGTWNGSVIGSAYGGTGLSNPAAHSLAIGEGSSAFGLLTSPSSNGNCIVSFDVTASATVDPTCAMPGVPWNPQSGSYLIAYTDRLAEVPFTGSSAVSFSMPVHTTTGFGLNFAFVTPNFGTATLTLTPTTDTIDGGATQSVFPQWMSQNLSDSSGNWHTIRLPMFGAFPNCVDTGGNHLNFATATGVFSCGTSSSGGSGGANTALSNLASVAINSSLLPGPIGVDLGASTTPFRNLYLYGAGSYGAASIELTGTPTSNRVWTIQDATDTFVGRATPDTLTNKSIAQSEITGRYWSCQSGLGDGLNAVPAGTYLQTFCYNDTGSTVTLSGVKCFIDGGTSSTLNATNGAGTGLLTGAVTCSTSFAAGTQSATTTIASGDFIKFSFVADGTAKQSTWVVTGSY